MRSLVLAPLALALALVACEPPVTPPPGDIGFTCDGNLCTVTGPIKSDVTFTADKQWLLKGGVFVGDDADPTAAPATLTIEPGTTVFGDTATLSFLLVTRGSKLVADGTAAAPILFTSSKAEGSRARGDWGGIVLNGQAPVNGCTGDPCVVLGEAGTGTFGGGNADDDSGVLRFVRVEFAGALIDDENEFNGFAFQGVGRGTTLENLQAHMVSDDCVEFFGGTVDAKRIVCTGVGDDNLDWTFGWTGRLQFMVGHLHPDAGGNGIEADNNEANNELTPVSRPVLSNLSLIGSGGANSKVGVLLRRGTQAEIHNSVVQSFGELCFDMDDAATFASAVSNGALTGDTIVANSIFDCAALTDDAAEDPYALSEFLLTMNDGNEQGASGLDVASLTNPSYSPVAGSAAATGGAAVGDAFFEATSFRGACAPADDWTQGWTAFPAN